MTGFVAGITAAGWATTPPLLTAAELAALAAGLEPLSGAGNARNLLDVPAVVALARSPAVRALAESVLGPGCVAVRGLLFDKTPDSNWKVPWHQDLTVALRDQSDAGGFGPWSVKGGVVHAHAPLAVLESMLAVRVHLDDCGPENGPVRLLSGTHTLGKLSGAEIDRLAADRPAELGIAGAGAVLAFRPLTLHASSAATCPGRRRVVHLEFAGCELPAGLGWRWEV